MTWRLEVSIGPVQDFVVQSRRTRDLWGSSFLLSFLSTHAMCGAQRAGGRVVQPDVVRDHLYGWVAGQPSSGESPSLGTMPNHFIAECDERPEDVAAAAIGALDQAWRRVCGAVWGRFVSGAAARGLGTEQIWQRQVDSFWQVMWVAGQGGEDDLLTRRKLWRSHWRPDEPGDKCTVMHHFQELSGHTRVRSADSRRAQDSFWESVRQRTGVLDLRDGERLCAIAMVKRLFPRVAEEALGWTVDTARWPSTVYVGAVPWIRGVAAAAPDTVRAYADAVRELAPSGAVRHHPPPFDNLTPAGAGDFAKLDANFLHCASVDSPRLCPLKNEEPAVRVALRDRLRQLYRLTTATNGDPEPAGGPPAYYGLLVADGDHLGRLIREKRGDRVGQALATFTARLPEIIRRRDGVPVYAGGDDVLAMLAVPGALACADDLARCYADACRPELGADATLSAAVLFAHVRYPLGAALREARRLLDVVAKNANGRGSVAAGILQPGGLRCQWVTTWERRLPGDVNVRAVELISQLAARLGHDGAQPGLSSALVYRLRDSLTLLCNEPRWEPGAWSTLPGGLDVRAYLRAEIAHSLEGQAIVEVDGAASDLADVVWRLLGRAQGPDRARGDAGVVDATKVCVDPLLLARMVASGGRVERQA